MTLRIDKAGRIILPKPLRERLQLREGCLEERPDGLFFDAIAHRPFRMDHSDSAR
jgi:bifunctional DNA-binding transcriptional regulator/antitoxin component of YhaV-PrlF toxin-antitoxin module